MGGHQDVELHQYSHWDRCRNRSDWAASFVSKTNEAAGSGPVAVIGSGTGSVVGISSGSGSAESTGSLLVVGSTECWTGSGFGSEDINNG